MHGTQFSAIGFLSWMGNHSLGAYFYNHQCSLVGTDGGDFRDGSFGSVRDLTSATSCATWTAQVGVTLAAALLLLRSIGFSLTLGSFSLDTFFCNHQCNVDGTGGGDFDGGFISTVRILVSASISASWTARMGICSHRLLLHPSVHPCRHWGRASVRLHVGSSVLGLGFFSGCLGGGWRLSSTGFEPPANPGVSFAVHSVQ